MNDGCLGNLSAPGFSYLLSDKMNAFTMERGLRG